LLMSPIITFMFEPAKLQMNWASASGAINRRALRRASPGARPSGAEELTQRAFQPAARPNAACPPPPRLGRMPKSRGGTADPGKRHESRLLPSTRQP
jgi:hypothetical protein